MDSSYSQCNQDRCAVEILGSSGRFLDIGSGPPVQYSNTYLLEQKGWSGICVDAQPMDYSGRACTFIQGTAVPVIHNRIQDVFFDYISLDIDDHTNRAVLALLEKGITFRFATIEHDKYRLGPRLQKLQQAMLSSMGYVPMFIDIKAHFDHMIVFEDWWCHPDIHQSTIAIGVTDLQALEMIRKL